MHALGVGRAACPPLAQDAWLGLPGAPSAGWVDVWVTRLDAMPDDGAAQGLDALECARAQRFRRRAHRQMFVAAHAMQRALLACYAQTLPHRLLLAAGPSGKPLPIRRADGSLLHHNLSHTADWMLLAVSPDAPVGVDIEQVQQRENLDDLARVVFSPTERRAWTALGTDVRNQAFHLGWTQKEAWLKSQGLGLAAPPDGAQVSFRAGSDPVRPPPAASNGGCGGFTGETRLVQARPPLVATVIALTRTTAIRWRR